MPSTRAKCIAQAATIAGAFLAQAIRGEEYVWDAMARAYGLPRRSAKRMLAALEAAQRGGDIRGKQSAAILIVGCLDREAGDRVVDLRRGPRRSRRSAGWSPCTAYQQ
jgi:uncharacterized Ntn-hydrolase superfamily protein